MRPGAVIFFGFFIVLGLFHIVRYLSCTDWSRLNEPITITLTTWQAAVLMGAFIGTIVSVANRRNRNEAQSR